MEVPKGKKGKKGRGAEVPEASSREPGGKWRDGAPRTQDVTKQIAALNAKIKALEKNAVAAKPVLDVQAPAPMGRKALLAMKAADPLAAPHIDAILAIQDAAKPVDEVSELTKAFRLRKRTQKAVEDAAEAVADAEQVLQAAKGMLDKLTQEFVEAEAAEQALIEARRKAPAESEAKFAFDLQKLVDTQDCPIDLGNVFDVSHLSNEMDEADHKALAISIEEQKAKFSEAVKGFWGPFVTSFKQTVAKVKADTATARSKRQRVSEDGVGVGTGNQGAAGSGGATPPVQPARPQAEVQTAPAAAVEAKPADVNKARAAELAAAAIKAGREEATAKTAGRKGKSASTPSTPAANVAVAPAGGARGSQ